MMMIRVMNNEHDALKNKYKQSQSLPFRALGQKYKERMICFLMTFNI